MTDNGPLDLFPNCGVFLAAVAVVLLAFEVGFRVELYLSLR